MHDTRTDYSNWLVCPHCFHDLILEDARLLCSGCSQEYPIVDGIPCFAPSDEFYDAYSSVHCPYALSPHGLKGQVLRFLPFWSWREWRFWRSVIPRHSCLLDLGCGRGREIFVERAGKTVGFDGSHHFIRDCATHYDLAVQGALPHLPFRPGAFDVVVSSHVIGHIPPQYKDELIAQIARVLRPGGLAAHIIEVDSLHPTLLAAKQKPDVYQRQFLEQDGHVGLEFADRVIERFAGQGFQPRVLRVVDALVPSLQNYRKYLSHPAFAELPGVTPLRRLNGLTTTNGVANALYEVGMGTFHHTVEQWFGPPQQAQFIMVAFQKPDERQ